MSNRTVCDISTGRLINTLEDHSKGLKSVAISPESTKIVSGSMDGSNNTIKPPVVGKQYYLKLCLQTIMM
ncbi:MAG: hypothetical protein WA364_02855 [Candidatus Nitrosopolaris sp.]